MNKKVETGRYIFKGNDAAYSTGANGKLERDRNGQYIMYDKDDAVNYPMDLVNSGTIEPGLKIDNKDGKFIKYIFVAEGEKEVYKHIVMIEKKYLEENRKYVEKLDQISKEKFSVRVKKKAKQLLKDTAIAFAFVSVLTTGTIMIDKLTDDGIDHEAIAQEQFFEQNGIYFDSNGNVHKGMQGEHHLTEEDKVSSIIHNLASGNLSEEEIKYYNSELQKLGYIYDAPQNTSGYSH